jgi:GntR family transcriptional regulator
MLESTNKTPLYLQLFSTLAEQIQKEMNPNDKLPTEKEICDEYCVSRTTVRLAMNELEKMGYIYRLQGKGSFVSAIKHNLNSFFILNLSEHYAGIDVNSLNFKIYSFSKMEAPLVLCHQMGLQNEKNILCLQLVHFIEQKAICLEKLILKNQAFRFLDQETFKRQNFDKILNEQGINLKACEESYHLTSLSLNEQKILQTNQDYCLLIKKLLYDDSNELIAISERKIISNDFIYQNFVQLN